MIKGFLAALHFLTIIRIAKGLDTTGEKLGRSMTCFPVVGLFLGLVLVAVRYISNYIFPPSIVDLLLIVTLVIITGALHLDGFADTADGLAGGKDREKVLAIMRDNRIGSFAVAGLILLLILKIFALQQIPPEIKNDDTACYRSFNASLRFFLPETSRRSDRGYHGCRL